MWAARQQAKCWERQRAFIGADHSSSLLLLLLLAAAVPPSATGGCGSDALSALKRRDSSSFSSYSRRFAGGSDSSFSSNDSVSPEGVCASQSVSQSKHTKREGQKQRQRGEGRGQTQLREVEETNVSPLSAGDHLRFLVNATRLLPSFRKVCTADQSAEGGKRKKGEGGRRKGVSEGGFSHFVLLAIQGRTEKDKEQREKEAENQEEGRGFGAETQSSTTRCWL